MHCASLYTESILGGTASASSAAHALRVLFCNSPPHSGDGACSSPGGTGTARWRRQGFSWCQHRFFHLLVHCLENPCLLRAAENILPDTALLESAVRDFNLSQREEIFAALARILGELRRTDVRKAGESAAGYATLVLGFLEARTYRQKTDSGLSLSHVDSSGKQEKSCRTYKKF